MDDTLSREAFLESLTARGYVVRRVAAGRYELTSVPQASVNAEAIPPGASVTTLELDSAEWHDLLSVSLHGAFYTLREGAKLMVERAKAERVRSSILRNARCSVGERKMWGQTSVTGREMAQRTSCPKSNAKKSSK